MNIYEKIEKSNVILCYMVSIKWIGKLVYNSLFAWNDKLEVERRKIKMDMEVFKEFNQKCSQELPNEIDKIL